MLNGMKLALVLSVFSVFAQAGEPCTHVKNADDTKRVYSDGRVWARNQNGCWTNTGSVGRENYAAIRERAIANSNNTIESFRNSNTTIASGRDSNTSIYSGRTSNTTITGPGDSNTTIANDGRKNITIQGSGPATVRYSGSSNLSRNYYSGR